MTQKTSLYEEHLSLGAKMVDFAGFEMPIQYNNLKEEALAVRNGCGVFDVSHMGEFFIEGPQTYEFLDYLLPNDIKKAQIGKAIYSPLCREDGTIIDDLIVYKLTDSKALICVNAANIDKDKNWISTHAKAYDVIFSDQSNEWSLVAIQGPKTAQIMSQLFPKEIIELPYYGVMELSSQNMIVARTGYTGEDGFEIFASHADIKKIWPKLLELNVTPCGLGSRDVLRLEVAFPLYGNELNDSVTPLDSALKWTVKMHKDFIGKEKLAKYQPQTKLIKLQLDRGIPRSGHEVYNQDEEKIGEITSGSMSVVLGKGVGIARIKQDIDIHNTQFLVDIRGKKYSATYHQKAFITGGHK